MSNTSSSSDASRQTRLLFQVLDKLPMALFAFRADGKPAFANRAARELFGKKKLVTAGEFVAHFGLTFASDNATYPSDKFPLNQVYQANDNESVSVNDVLLPESNQPDRRFKIEATPQRAADGELELVLLFMEPVVGEQLTDNQLELEALRSDLTAKTEQLEQLQVDNEQLNEELMQAQEQTAKPAEADAATATTPEKASEVETTSEEESASEEETASEAPQTPSPTADSESATDQPGTAVEATDLSAEPPFVDESAARDATLKQVVDPEEAGHDRIVDALDSASVALDKLENAADSDRRQSLSTQIVALRQQLKEARNEVQNREETIRVQSKELTDKLLQLDDVEAQRSQLAVRAENAESGISILERRLEAVQSNYTEKLTEVEALKKEMAKLEARHAKDSSLYEQTQQDYMEQASQLANLRKQVNDQKQELLELSTKRHDLVAEIETMKRQQTILEDELNGKNLELRSLRQTLSHAMRATNDAIAEKERLEQRLLKSERQDGGQKTAVISPSSGELAQLDTDEARLYEELQDLEAENRQMQHSLKNLEALIISLPEELLTDSGVAPNHTQTASTADAEALQQREAALLAREERLGTLASLGLEATQLAPPIQRLTAQLEQHFPQTAQTLVGLLDRLPKLYRDLSPVFQPQLIASIERILSAEATPPTQQQAIIDAIEAQLPQADAETCIAKVQERALQFEVSDTTDLFGLRKTPEIIDLLADIQDLAQALQRANDTAADLLVYAELMSLLNGEDTLSPLPLNTLIERFAPLVGEATLSRFDYSALETMPAVARSASAGLLQIIRLCGQLPPETELPLHVQLAEHHLCVIFPLHSLPQNDRVDDLVTRAQDLLTGKPHFVKVIQADAGLEVHFCVKQQKTTDDANAS